MLTAAALANRTTPASSTAYTASAMLAISAESNSSSSEPRRLAICRGVGIAPSSHRLLRKRRGYQSVVTEPVVALTAARPSALAYVGNENGTSASCCTVMPAVIATAASCASLTARSPTT